MVENKRNTDEAPDQNFSKGLMSVEIPELGSPIKGKVRDCWIINKNGIDYRAMVTTDRQSAFDRLICTVPGKGQVLNMLSAYWFDKTREIVANHMVEVPHPNVLIARQAKETFPVEVVLRRYMAKSSTTTSIYHNYTDKERREIYGIKFPDGLKPNQEFPMGTVLTPTTKAESGHDQELADEQALEIVDSKLGNGTWDKVKVAAHRIFENGSRHYMDKGLILVDTKYEFGIDSLGNLMLIDEVHTPDSSRLWLAETYGDKFKSGQTPDTFDKDILRRWLVEKGFKGEGLVPKVDTAIVDAMIEAYAVPYRMVTGKTLSSQDDPKIISEEVSYHIKAFASRSAK
jgi:phosphoribosylaminoimidazole-succinocarboxamide synthase